MLRRQVRNLAPLEITDSTKQTLRSIIVDVDDKNCLAQLTVVQELNQGAGNGCKSLPVCFSFVLSFAQAKERT